MPSSSNPERWQRIEELYHAALKLEPARRSAFLQSECRDDLELRREVESLLAAKSKAGDFLPSGAMKDAAKMLAEEQPLTLVGKKLGHYQVLSLLGSGGMAVVYKAEDTRLHRLVAPCPLRRHRKAAYQDFFTLWKDADPDIPILKQARADHAKLQ